MAEDLESVLQELRELASFAPNEIAKKRIVPVESVIGVSYSDIRSLARKLDNDLALSKFLWNSGFLEARALAILIIPPSQADRELLDDWVQEIPDWSTCDLFAKSLVCTRPDAMVICAAWSARTQTFIRRAGLASLANFCMRQLSFDDQTSAKIHEIIKMTASDKRPHVRKACCWALREFGKSNSQSHELSCELALELINCDNAAIQWVGNCAYRELEQLVEVPERRRLISRKSAAGRRSTQP